jgi:hypothetical protein
MLTAFSVSKRCFRFSGQSFSISEYSPGGTGQIGFNLGERRSDDITEGEVLTSLSTLVDDSLGFLPLVDGFLDCMVALTVLLLLLLGLLLDGFTRTGRGLLLGQPSFGGLRGSLSLGFLALPFGHVSRCQRRQLIELHDEKKKRDLDFLFLVACLGALDLCERFACCSHVQK